MPTRSGPCDRDCDQDTLERAERGEKGAAAERRYDLARRAKRAARSYLSIPLYWTSEPLPDDLDVAGDIELRLTATTTAPGTAWIAALKDVAPGGSVTNVTGGWQRATLREVDDAASRTGAPVAPSRDPQLIPIGEPVEYRIPLVPNAGRFVAGHRIQLMLTSDDQPKATPVFLDYRHVPVGNNTRNTVSSQSRLLLPVMS